MNRKRLFILSISILAICALLFLTGPSLLLYPLIEEPYFPMGTIIAWFTFLSFPISILTGYQNIYSPTTKLERVIKYCLFVIIALAIIWPVVSFYLADNWALNFKRQEAFRGSTRAASVYWKYNMLLIAGPMISWLLIIALKIKKFFTPKT